tara:strand:- start:252 stop:1295 length:1044 start_codon:yes stop_codon:yes gene_type:complete
MKTTYKLFKNNHLIEKIYNFREINLMLTRNLLKIPECQSSLDDDKVKELVNLYQKDNTIWVFRNKVVIGNLNNNLYIIDGQHRITSASVLSKHNYEGELIFCEYKCKDDSDIRYLFNITNKDSHKNQFYINNEELTKIKIDNFMNELKNKYPLKDKIFTRNLSRNNPLKTYQSFRDDLIKINFFENFNNTNDMFDYILQKNDEFYDKYNYSTNLENNESCFYKNELLPLNNKIVFTSNKNNFIDYLENNNIRPFHLFKSEKNRIAKTLKTIVWNKWYPNSIEDICPISNCNNIIYNDNYSCGHIIAESRGGYTNSKNLRPLCKSCNSSMGSNNWDEYDINSYKIIDF